MEEPQFIKLEQKQETFTYEIKDIYKEAESTGLNVVESHPNWLLLDIDKPEQIIECENLISMFERVFSDWIQDYYTTISKSGKGRHYYIKLNHPVDNTYRILLQAILGSDLKREILNLRRMLVDNFNPVIGLLETDEEYKKVKGFMNDK